MPRLMGCTHGVTDPASRFRFLQYVPLLEQAGWEVSHRPCIPSRPWRSPLELRALKVLQQQAQRLRRVAHRWRDIRDATRFDVVFLSRDLLGGDPRWEARLVRRNPRVVFDFDDAVYEAAGGRQAEWMCRHAAWVTAGNETLAAWARQFSERVSVLPTVVDVAAHERAAPRPGGRRVGWCGSDRSIAGTLIPQLPMLARLQQELDFELVVMTRPRPVFSVPGLRWVYVEWNDRDEKRLGEFLDIGIMPLPDTPFHRGKCGLKLLQYMACGLPFVATPLGVNVALAGSGARGFTAADEAAWRAALVALLAQPRLGAEMGARGRAFCAEHYDLPRWAPVLSAILQRAAGQPAASAR